MTTDGLVDVLQGDLRRLGIETVWAAAIAAIAALCGVLVSSIWRGECWLFRRTRRAFAWGAVVGVAAWLVTLFGAQLVDLKSPQADVSWQDNRTLWYLRLLAASGVAALAAFRAHQRTLRLVDRANRAPPLANFRLRHLLAIQGAIAIVLCGWLANARSRMIESSWDRHLAQRALLAKELFEPYGFKAQLTRGNLLSLHPMTDGARPVTDETLAQIAEFGGVRSLSFRGNSITPEGWEHLASLEDLRELRIVTEELTPEGAAALASLPSLQSLQIDCLRLDESAAAALSKSPNLAFLDLKSAPLTDQGLANVAALPGLYALSLDGSLVTAQGVARFAELRPYVMLSLRNAPRSPPRPLVQSPAAGQRPDID